MTAVANTKKAGKQHDPEPCCAAVIEKDSTAEYKNEQRTGN
jgi:hypothetical protein